MILRTTDAFILLVSIHFLQSIHAFSVLPNNLQRTVSSSCRPELESTTSLHAASAGGAGGMGMAATAASVKKNNKKVKKNEKTAAPKNGMCKKISSGGGKNIAGVFDVSASLTRLEKRYGELELAAAKQELARQDDNDDDDDETEDPRWASDGDKVKECSQFITSEFIVAARSSCGRLGVDDWVPVAQLLVSRPDNNDDNISSSTTSRGSSSTLSSMDLASLAVSAYCRELSHLAALGAPAFFKSVARNGLEYSLESMDSFHKHVYTGVIDGGHAKVMTKAEARKVLGLEEASSSSSSRNANGNSTSDDDSITTTVNPKSAIKKAYRRLSFDLHPDRFQGETPEDHEAAAQRFALVKQAYESLSSGVRNGGGPSGGRVTSWYESLGGKSRTDFVGPVNLLSLTTALDDLNNKHGCEAAIAGLDKDLIQSFVARNLRSAE
jgi:DnaJ domain